MCLNFGQTLQFTNFICEIYFNYESSSDPSCQAINSRRRRGSIQINFLPYRGPIKRMNHENGQQSNSKLSQEKEGAETF